MTPELMYLVWSVAVSFVLVLIAVSGATLEYGLPKVAGNREGLPELTGWARRAAGAHRNMLENLILFAVLVFTAHIANIHNGMTLLGAQLFFWGRLAHALYISPEFHGLGLRRGSYRSLACCSFFCNWSADGLYISGHA